MSRWQCRRQRSALVDYVDGGASDAAAVKLQAHLGDCVECREALVALRALPVELNDVAIPDPGEEFWLQQRQAISRAIRSAPQPRRSLTGWLAQRFEQPRLAWRLPVAATASLLLAVSVYRFALTDRHIQLAGSSASVSSLDDDSLDELHDLVGVVAPRDESISSGLQDDELLTSLPLTDLIGLSGGGGGVVSIDLDGSSPDPSDGANDDLS
ncbi:MAG: zf-HC2 domain-containing protein [Deltaproteobacteria bacterium]|nr:zf-HC2 domain-containing protein [Deltaproteobacteria bacterium]